MSERGTTEVPVQPQVILKTSKKLKLSCLHIGVPFFYVVNKIFNLSHLIAVLTLAVCIRFPLELRNKKN